MSTEPRPELMKTFAIEVKVLVRGDVQARNAVEASRTVGEQLRAVRFTEDVELRIGEISARERRL
jgi:hypothetical protein